MTGNSNPPIIIGIIGALIALEFPQVVIGIAVITVALIVFRLILKHLKSKEQEFRTAWRTIDSKLASWYYRNRAKILYKLGLIGRN